MTAGMSTINKKTRGPALPLRISPSPPPVNVAPVSRSSRYPAGSRIVSGPATTVNKKTEGPTLPRGIYPPPPLVNVSSVSRFRGATQQVQRLYQPRPPCLFAGGVM